MDGIIAHSSLPLRMSFYVGLVIALAAVLLAGFYLSVRLFSHKVIPPGFTTTQILILFGIRIDQPFPGSRWYLRWADL